MKWRHISLELMPFDELPNGEGWIAAALPSALYPVSQLDRQRVEMWKTALRRGTLEWQLWAEAVWKLLSVVDFGRSGGGGHGGFHRGR
jgi:hypothetical protein